MRHARGKPPDGGKLLIVFYLGKGRHPPFVAGFKTAHKMLHQQMRNNHDDGNAAAQHDQQFAAQARPRTQQIRGGLDGHQRQIRSRKRRIGGDQPRAVGVHDMAHGGFQRARRKGNRQIFQRLAVESGICLQDAASIAQEGVGILHEPHRGHQLFQLGRVDGDAQGPSPAVLLHALHGDDHMGNTAQTEKDVADIAALDLRFMQPGLLGVIGVEQCVGPHIGHLPPLVVHEPHVHESLEFALERHEHARQGRAHRQFVEIVGMRDKAYRGRPFAEKELQRGLRLADQRIKGIFHFPRKGAHVLGMIDAGEQQQGHDRYGHHQPGHDAPQGTVAFRGHFVGHLEGMPERIKKFCFQGSQHRRLLCRIRRGVAVP